MISAKKRILLIIFVLTLSAFVTVGISYAYFTDYDTAKGTASVKLSGETVIKEEFQDNKKIISVYNRGDGDAVVRVGIFGPDGMQFEYENPSDWYHDDGDDFWYYKSILPAEGTTSKITVKLDNIPKDVELSEMDITVVHESVPVALDDDGYCIVPDGWEKVVKAE